MAAARSLLSGLVLSAVVLTGLAVPAGVAQTPSAARPPGPAFTLAPATLEPAAAVPANLGVAMNLPLDDNLPAATGPNGHLAGARSAAGMVSRDLTDTITAEPVPTQTALIMPGRGFDPMFRCYSPNAPLFDGTWIPPDVEPV